jgi:hypothetical protein
MLTLARIQAGIEAEMKRIDELVNQIAKAGDEAAETESAYKVAFARKRLEIRAYYDKPTVGQCDDEAMEATADLHLAYLLGSNRLTVARESLRSAQARLDGLRTLAASFRVAGG